MKLTFALFKFCIEEAVTTDESLGLIFLLERAMEDKGGYIYKWVESQGEGFSGEDRWGTKYNITNLQSLYEAVIKGY